MPSKIQRQTSLYLFLLIHLFVISDCNLNQQTQQSETSQWESNSRKWGCKVTYVDLYEFLIDTDDQQRNCDLNFELETKTNDQNQGLQLFNQQIEEHGGQWNFQDSQGLILKKIIDQNERIDLDTADLVFVFDYCIKYENGSIQNTDRNVSRLKKAYDKLLQTSRWRKFNGQDYLFILAHPVEIWMDTKIGSYYCNFFSESLYIQIESLFSCVQQFQKLDIPYVSTIVPQNYIPIHNRKIFLTFRGECNSLQQIGKRLRKTVIEVIKQQNFPLVDVSCSCKHCKDRKSYADNIYELQRSIFCLILAGDSFSSRRLSDAVMAGCLPVFIGPPFHTFPFRNYVNYASFSVIIHVGNATWYQEQQPAQNRFKSEGDQNWIISVLNVEEIVPKLKEIKLSQLDNKLRQMEKYRGMFEYYPNVHGNVSAVDVIFKHMCGIVKKRKQNRYV